MTKESKSGNMNIWDRVEATDPAYTKNFSRGGGFKGTSINAQYNIKKATQIFGPNGIGWGVDILDEKYVEGKPLQVANDAVLCREVIHVLKVSVWYVIEGERFHTSPQFGQTTFVGANKYGPFTDEEAPKKTMTDAMNKCLALLGFGGDIFLGLYDDNKYVNDKKAQFVQEKKAEEKKAQANDPNIAWAKNFDKKLQSVKTIDELEKLKSENAEGFKKIAAENKALARQVSTRIQTMKARIDAALEKANDNSDQSDLPSHEGDDYYKDQGAS